MEPHGRTRPLKWANRPRCQRGCPLFWQLTIGESRKHRPNGQVDLARRRVGYRHVIDPFAWAWNLEAVVLVPALTVAYLVATRVSPTPRWRIACFLAAMALIVAAFVTPLQTLALDYLVSAHLLQNVVLAEWAPLLIVLGVAPALAAEAGRRAFVRAFTHPFVALPLWLVTYFVWHLPWLYEEALENPQTLLHLEHACYLVAGVLFWWPVVHERPWPLSSGARAAYLFAAFVLASPLGLLLTLLPNPLYDFYEAAPERVWGLSPLGDQQLGGVAMAGEQAIVLFAGFAFFFLRFLAEQEHAEAATGIGRSAPPRQP
jgi:cytochrome c oxidase assembly factor CtaG